MKVNDQRMLRRTGQQISALGMGCASLGNLFQAISDLAAQITVDAAWNVGIRLFDTAPYYGYGYSEHRLGSALRARPRGEFRLSTKVGRLLRPGGDHRSGGENGWVDPLPFEPVYDYTAGGVRRSIEDSLQRLGVAWIDIALVHDIGQLTHADRHEHYWQQLTAGGGFRELEAMRGEGLIGAFGLGVNEWQVAMTALDHVDLDCTLLAGRYTLLEQGALHPFLDQALAREVGVLIGGPFNSGILATGPGSDARFDYQLAPPEVIARVEKLHDVCREFDVPLAAAAIQFPLAHPAVVSCIPGFRSPRELADIVRWFETPIPADLWQSLLQQGLLAGDSPVPPSPSINGE